MKRIFWMIFALSLGCPWAVHAAQPTDPFNESPIVSSAAALVHLDFDAMPIGVTPPGIETLVLNGHASGLWTVQGDAHDPRRRSLVYGIAREASPTEPTDLSFDDEKPSADRRTWAVALANNAALDTADVSVAFNIASGADARAGFLYRYQDPSAFYLLECDANGEFFTVFRVQKGKWKVVNRISGVITPDVWHTLRIIFQEDTYVVFFDNEMMIGGKDKKGLLAAGRIGLAAVSDGSTAFDHFVIRAPAAVRVPATTSPSH